jgi:hypothetical protein
MIDGHLPIHPELNTPLEDDLTVPPHNAQPHPAKRRRAIPHGFETTMNASQAQG